MNVDYIESPSITGLTVFIRYFGFCFPVWLQVHAYIQADTEKTRYLSEIKSGDEVMVVDPAGRHAATG